MNYRQVLPANERERIAALQRYKILDTPPDGAFDRITKLAARLLNVPIAIVSLVDTDRIWFKSHHGLEVEEIDRAPGLCASAIMEDVPYILSDASIDPRSLANPLVAGEFGLRFYAGIPLQTSDNYNLGVLCVIDFQPRTIKEEEIEILKSLAQLVMDQMELRLAARRVDELHQELRQAHETLRIQATHDALTGLWNRGAIMEMMAKSLALSRREKQPLTIMLVDIDFFRQINDNYGHSTGDKVLVEVAKRLEENCRSSDAIGRIGGEEFLIVMYPCNREQSRSVAERYCGAISRNPFKIGQSFSGSINVTVSGGIFSTEMQPNIDAKLLTKFADDALYASKERGRNRVTVCGYDLRCVV